MVHQFEVPLGNRSLILETGRMAKQAGGSVLARYGDTVVLATVCVAKEGKEGMDYFPLSVEYQERTYAGGKIPGGYFRREGKLTEKEILTSRLIDRPIRPLFPEGFYNEVQVVVSLLSSDKENNSDFLAMNAASAALMISSAPFYGPVAAARIGQLDGQFVINPTFKEIERCTLDLMVAVTELGVIMIEAGASEVSEALLVEALEFAAKTLKPVLDIQKKMKETCGKPAGKYALILPTPEASKKVEELAAGEIRRINEKERTKESRDLAMQAITKKCVEALVTEESGVTELQVEQALYHLEHNLVRDYILDSGTRPDGRRYDEIRPITAEIGVLPRTHGSALFTRGQTQSLGVATLGTSRDEQMIDAIEGDLTKSFMLHYNFPPFSVGEIKPMRGPGRRENGHGALAERGLRAVIPAKEKFPYTIRLVSDILESNGSSSMASVCSGTLAMMDAGVPITAPVSGIAMGLVKKGDRVAVLSD
ncbi:MAG: polyribonucleotide nucleotidyltransferase, partial [Candidatus Omnitrophota bacterium]